MPSMFHYTDSAGLLGILNSRCLFATDYRYLNDTSEGSMIRKLLLPIFETEAREIMTKLADKEIIKGFFRELHGTSGHRLQAEQFYTSIVSTLQNSSPLFVLSFCRHDTTTPAYIQGLLSQWRGYGGSAGFAIEFDEDELDKLVTYEGTAYAYGVMRSRKVEYHDYEQIFDPKTYKGVAGELIRLGFLGSRPGISMEEIANITGQKELGNVVREFAKTAPFLKHSGFEEEKEYRVAAACIREGKLFDPAKQSAKQIKFRERRRLIVPYIELFRYSKLNLPIKSIIVGPHPLQEKQVDAVRLALEPTPFAKAEVRRSEIPFAA
jgi:hypothetical protein